MSTVAQVSNVRLIASQVDNDIDDLPETNTFGLSAATCILPKLSLLHIQETYGGKIATLLRWLCTGPVLATLLLGIIYRNQDDDDDDDEEPEMPLIEALRPLDLPSLVRMSLWRSPADRVPAAVIEEDRQVSGDCENTLRLLMAYAAYGVHDAEGCHMGLTAKSSAAATEELSV